MRTTLAIADDILRELKGRARARGKPLTQIANEVLRAGLAAIDDLPRQRQRHKEKPVDMGTPEVDLTKALRLVDALAHEEVARKLDARK